MIKGQYDAKIIYEMELHEFFMFSKGLCLTRVPGGWIYAQTYSLGEKKELATVFVPYNNEFKKTEDPITAQEILKCNKITDCEIDQW